MPEFKVCGEEREKMKNEVGFIHLELWRWAGEGGEHLGVKGVLLELAKACNSFSRIIFWK